MAYRRRFARRRRYGKKRTYKFGMYKKRYQKPITRLKESFIVGSTSTNMLPSVRLVNPNSTDSQVINFTANEVTNWVAMKQLFDLYRITGARVLFMPHMNSSTSAVVSGSTAIGQTMPTLYIAPNRDPFVGAPANIDDILNDDFVKVRRLDKPYKFYIKAPKFQNEIRNASGTTQGMDVTQLGVQNKFQPWLPTGGGSASYGADDYKHYGFRYIIDNIDSQVQFNCDIIYTIYLELKEKN